ncbi:MAG TPA: histidinol-phosphatase HisJ family protein [Chthoniobacterales bacterium]|jgi:histidinol-phosphatase (PHP family)
MLADYHTHTPLCRHATGAPVEYAMAAMAMGLAEVGISDHSPMPEPFDDWRMEIGELDEYFALVAEARSAVAPFPVRLGLEVDYFAGQESWIETLAGRAPWDYLIGSVHYIGPGWDVDNPKWIGRFDDRPVEEIWEIYFAEYEKCIRSGFFDIVAHPDLPKKFGHRPAGDLRPFYEPVIAALADTGTVMEVSTAGLRKPVAEIYPARAMLEMAFSAGVEIVVSSDAHAPEEVGADFSIAEQLIRDVGYTSTVQFARRARTRVPLA